MFFCNKKWKSRITVFVGGLNEEFEGVGNHIVNAGILTSIEKVYS